MEGEVEETVSMVEYNQEDNEEIDQDEGEIEHEEEEDECMEQIKVEYSKVMNKVFYNLKVTILNTNNDLFVLRYVQVVASYLTNHPFLL